MSDLNPVTWELLSPTERAILRTLDAHQGTFADGYSALAQAMARTETWITVVLGRLRKKGWVEVRRPSRRAPSRIALTEEARRVVMTELVSSTAHPALDGFLGDVEARKTARILARIGRANEAPSGDYARYYLDSADPREVARLESLTDEWGELPFEVTVTRDAMLDDGLRLIYRTRARRAMSRQRAMDGLPK